LLSAFLGGAELIFGAIYAILDQGLIQLLLEPCTTRGGSTMAAAVRAARAARAVVVRTARAVAAAVRAARARVAAARAARARAAAVRVVRVA
jgi:hypothetical protein